MGKPFKLNIITPDNKNIKEDVVSLITENADGKIEFLANHADAIVSIVPTVTTLEKEDGTKKHIFTANGIAYFKDKALTICCDSANWPEEISQIRAEEAKERALKRLKSDESIDKERAQFALARALARLALKQY